MVKILREHGFISVLISLLTFQCVDLHFTSTTSLLSTSYVILIAMLLYKVKYFAPGNKRDYRIVGIYFLWMLTAGAMRGIWIVDNWTDGQNLITGIALAAVPAIVYAFASPYMLWKTLHLWIWFAVSIFVLFYFWVMEPDRYQFFFGPLFLTCFIPVLPNKWKIFLFIFLLMMLFGDFGARSQVAKATVVILICLGYYFRKWVPVRLYDAAHWLCYIVPIVSLYLAITGIFNPLDMMEQADDSFQTSEEDLRADTRTELYEETITSAVKNNYIWYGRSLARGNDSPEFVMYTSKKMDTFKYERYGHEFCHPNIFTWMGLIGVILYSLMYLKSSYLALYKSNSLWMKLISVFIAFNWAWGWIENTIEFNILNIGLWMVIAMGFSEQFRAMSDKEMETWVISLFKWKTI